MNRYKFYGLNFDKIYWSRLLPIRITSGGEYRCVCCNAYPHECKNESSAKEYRKIKELVEKEPGFGVSSYTFPIKETGYLRADQYSYPELIWKVQRELADRAGFILRRSTFW